MNIIRTFLCGISLILDGKWDIIVVLANKRTIFYCYTNFYIEKYFKQNKNFIRK